jgi:5-methylcytosine-specific restriction enzyme A
MPCTSMTGRSPSVDRIRGTTLQNIRARHFKRYPLCVDCAKVGVTTLARQLDHIIPLEFGGLDFDKDKGMNRQGLCVSCHEKKTAKDRGYVPRVEFDQNGDPVGV